MEEIATAIDHSEEQSKARAAIALHMASQGQVDKARGIALKLPIDHWRHWAQSHLDMLENASDVPVLNKQQPSLVNRTDTLDRSGLESICDALHKISQDVLAFEEVRTILAIAEAGNLEETVKLVRKFWQTKIYEGKTYLEVLAEQPRPLFLDKLQKLAPLLMLSLAEGEGEELISAIHDVSSWWP